MVTEHDMTLIEKSINGSLSDEETQEFNQKQKTSESFRKEITFQRELLANLEAHQKNELKGELKTLFRSIDAQETQRKPSSKRNWYGIAASVILLLGITWVIRLNQSDHHILFNKYYESFPAEGLMRGDSPKTDQQKVHQLYSNQEYQRVIDIIENQVITKVSFENQKLLLGISYLNLSNNEKAIKALKGVDQKNQTYIDCQWYLALAHLKKGEKGKCKAVLQNLNSKHSIYKSSIQSLLEDLQ